MSRRPWLQILLVATVFLVAFTPRVIQAVSRPTQWFTRSVQFIHEVGRGAWRETVYSEHPGVTTMWLAGLALRLAGITPKQGLDGAYVDPGALTARESAIGVFPLALVIAVSIVLMYSLLQRLFSQRAAFAAAILVALDPFFLSDSKVLHVDGLLAAFMVASALSLLVFLRERRRRWLVLSGIVGGLALLTKSPALFLVPYVGLCLGSAVLVGKEKGWRRAILAGLAWLGIAAAVYVVLYPAMWVDPVGTLRTVYTRAALRITWAHPSPIYFLGRPVATDPGPAYYPVVWGCKLTALTFVLAVVALLYAALDRYPRRAERRDVGLLLAFAFFFTLQMTIGAKKMPRYMTPAFPVVDILAGVGLVEWAGRLVPPVGRSRAAPTALMAAALVLQGLLVLPLHPYYDTHFNELVGPRAGIWALSTQWQGDGIDIAGRMLSRLPNADTITAASHMPTLFRQYFDGQTVEVDEQAEWYVFGINSAMRDEGTEDGCPWDFHRRRAPVTTIAFGGIPYVWVHRAADGPQNPLALRFGEAIQLVGYDMGPGPYQAGQDLRLQLYWRALAPVDGDYTVFVHLLDSSGGLVAQQDNQPVRGTSPTSQWHTGTMIVDPYDLVLPEDLVSGELRLVVGLYRWPELTRLPATSKSGEGLPNDEAVFATVTVVSPPPEPKVWSMRVLAGLVLVSAAVAGRRNRR